MVELDSQQADLVGALVRRAGEGEWDPPGEGNARAELHRRLFGGAMGPAAVDRFIVVSRLGQGGDGVVWGAWDPRLDRQVAIKVLRRRDARAEARLLHEARVLAKLRHPSIVQIHDVGRALQLAGSSSLWPSATPDDADAHEAVYLVMEHVAGGDLKAWLAASRRHWREIVHVWALVARGLAAAHRVGVVHRDVKPTNVLVGSDGRPRVVDFGLSRRDDATDGDVAGTVPYMAPEQHRGATPDGRADQYALGVSLYESIAGKRPFVGTASVMLRTKERGVYPKLEGVPRRLVRTIARALAPDPALRFADMDALARELEQTARGSRTLPWIGAAAAVAAVIAVPFVTDDPCAPPSHSPAAVWAEREHAEGDAPGEADAAAHVDAVVEAWDGAWRQVCAQHRGHTEVSTAVTHAQEECLERQAVAFAAAHGELVRQVEVTHDVAQLGATPSAIDAIALVDALEPVADCGVDPITALDADATWGPRRGWEHLARGRVLHELGRDADALAVLRGGWAAIDGANAPLLAARLHLADANAHVGLGEFERAKESLLEAVWQAEPVRDHATAASAWLELAWLEAVERDGPDAQRWLAFATAAVARAGNGARLVAELHHLRGGVHYRAERWDDALAEYGAALEAQHALVGQRHPWPARTLNHLGNTYFEAKRLDEAVAASSAALEIRRATLPAEHPAIAAALNNLAGMYIARGDGSKARALVRESLAMLAGQGGPHELVARVMQGRIELALGHAAVAAEDFRAALGVRMASIERTHPATLQARASLAALQRGTP